MSIQKIHVYTCLNLCTIRHRPCSSNSIATETQVQKVNARGYKDNIQEKSNWKEKEEKYEGNKDI